MNDEPSMTIGRFAREAGVPVSTVRYYERAGLLAPADRSAAGYRLYPRHAIDQVALIRSAQAMGLTLEDIKLLLAFENGDARCGDVKPVLEKRLEQVEASLETLERSARALEKALRVCSASDPDSGCKVLLALRAAGESGKGKRGAAGAARGARRGRERRNHRNA